MYKSLLILPIVGLSMSAYSAETSSSLWPDGTKNASVFRSYKSFALPADSNKDYVFDFTIDFGKVLIKPSKDNTVGIKVEADSQALQRMRFDFHPEGFSLEAHASQVLSPAQDIPLNFYPAIGTLTQGSGGIVRVITDSPQIWKQPMIGHISQGSGSSVTFTSFTSSPKKLEQKTVIYLPKSLPKSKISIQASGYSQCSVDSIQAHKMKFIFKGKAHLVTVDPIQANCIKIEAKDSAEIDLASEVIKMRISAKGSAKIFNITGGLLEDLKANLRGKAYAELKATVQDATGKILDDSEIHIGTITKDHQLRKHHQAQIHIGNILNLE